MKQGKLNLRARILARAEKIIGRYRSGPYPPAAEFRQQAELYFITNPETTPEQWIAYAQELACAAYREGYTHGFEHRERRIAQPEIDLAIKADLERHNTRLQEHAETPGKPGEIPPSAQEQAFILFGEITGRYKAGD